MDTVKHHRELEVRLPGSLGLNLMGGEVRVEERETEEPERETEEPEMTAGETLEVVCSLEEAWPVTNLSLAVTRGADSVWGELVTRPGQCYLCPVTMEQRAEVSLRSGDTGLEVRCHTGDNARGGRGQGDHQAGAYLLGHGAPEGHQSAAGAGARPRDKHHACHAQPRHPCVVLRPRSEV